MYLYRNNRLINEHIQNTNNFENGALNEFFILKKSKIYEELRLNKLQYYLSCVVYQPKSKLQKSICPSTNCLNDYKTKQSTNSSSSNKKSSVNNSCQENEDGNGNENRSSDIRDTGSSPTSENDNINKEEDDSDNESTDSYDDDDIYDKDLANFYDYKWE